MLLFINFSHLAICRFCAPVRCRRFLFFALTWHYLTNWKTKPPEIVYSSKPVKVFLFGEHWSFFYSTIFSMLHYQPVFSLDLSISPTHTPTHPQHPLVFVRKGLLPLYSPLLVQRIRFCTVFLWEMKLEETFHSNETNVLYTTLLSEPKRRKWV